MQSPSGETDYFDLDQNEEYEQGRRFSWDETPDASRYCHTLISRSLILKPSFRAKTEEMTLAN